MGAGDASVWMCHGTVGSSLSFRHRLVPCLSRLVSSRLVSSRLVSSRLVSSRLVSSRLVSSRLVSAAALALALAACGDGADTTKVPSTTPTPPNNPPQTLHSSLQGKTRAQQEALCEEDSTLLGCTGILATKRQRELEQQQAEMAKLKLPFGGKLSFSRTAVGGSETTLTGMLGVEAIRQAGLEAKPMLEIKNNPVSPNTEVTGNKILTEDDKYAAGAIFLSSSTGTGGDNVMLYGVQSGKIDRRPGGLTEDSAEVQNRYNIVTKFTPTASGKYSIEVFHARKDKGRQTRLDHNSKGASDTGHRNAAFSTHVNAEQSGAGTVTSLAKLSPTGTSAYMDIGSLNLNRHLGLEADDKMFEGWSYNILSGNSKILPDDAEAEGKFYAEVWDNYGVSKTDYMVGGVWLLMPESGDNNRTKFAAFAQTNSAYAKVLGSGLGEEIEGTATYNGLAAGFYVDGMDQVHRLLGKVTMNADFSSPVKDGTLGGSIHGITLNGEAANGSISLLPQPLVGGSQITHTPRTSKDSTVSGSINGTAVMGDWSAIFTGPATPANDTVKPTGVVGTASGYSADEKHTFAVSFGAKPPKKSGN